jgi:hypothetical protein
MSLSMSAPLLPPPFDQLEHRPFSFYPAIVGIEHNEWRLRKATWSEFLVINTKTALEIWIPRRFMGDLSRTDEPVMIVGLNREVEYRAGQVVPHVRRVIEMPRAVNETPRANTVEHAVPEAAPVVGIRFESGAESRISRLILWALGCGLLACVLFIAFQRIDRSGGRVSYAPVMQSQLGLGPQDDYHAVRRKLGEPASDRWREIGGEMQYRALTYKSPSVTVILMGTEREKALYIGAMDEQWRPVDAVSLPNGRNTYSLLRNLKRF